MMTAKQWLEKAVFTTADMTGGTAGGYLVHGQAMQFLRVAIDASVILTEVRTEFLPQPSFEVPRFSFGTRILKPGTEGARLSTGDQVKASTGLVTLNTVLLKGEVPISDESFEDNIERDALADTIMTMVGQRVGLDLEELAIKGDTARVGGEDTYLDTLDGIIKQCQSNLPTAQKISAASFSSYDRMFAAAVNAMPAKYRPDYARLRFYVPVKHRDGYQEALAARGTPLGDTSLTQDMTPQLAYRGIRVRGVPAMTGTDTINSGAIDYDTFGLLIDPMNLIAGYHRRVRVEKWREPREGVTYFLPTVRPDFKLANPLAAVLISGIGL